ncbi:MAG: phosphotransferase [Planctomycetota bacterium]
MPTADFPLISPEEKESVRDALQLLGLWEFGEVVMKVERAGEGNMNMVVRVVTTRRHIILKQSRPWVEKYPQIAAPVDRSAAEAGFYRLINGHSDVASKMPRLWATDAGRHLLALEDLGSVSDYSALYASSDVDAMPMAEATAWLVKLHSISLQETERSQFGCMELRKLNHQHMYQIPLQSPSVAALDEVCPGLESLATEIRSWPTLESTCQRLGSEYLQAGDYLLHGDFYPGSWLRTEEGYRVIDPEFTYAGPREFDLGVLAAHRVLCGGDADSLDSVFEAYREAGGGDLDQKRVAEFAALEIVRRLIGVAQLPLAEGINPRRKMAEIAKEWLV